MFETGATARTGRLHIRQFRFRQINTVEKRVQVERIRIQSFNGFWRRQCLHKRISLSQIWCWDDFDRRGPVERYRIAVIRDDFADRGEDILHARFRIQSLVRGLFWCLF